MKEKSKFMTFILSFIPGLPHFYLGYPERGLIYLIIFSVLCIGAIGLSMVTYSEVFLLILFGVPIIWLVALIDSFSIMDSIKYSGSASSIDENHNPEVSRLSNKKIISLALSVIPGAGHMYLGYQQKGLVLMGIFFFGIFFMGWLNLSVLLFLLPLIWFYSFFDAFHILNGNNIEDMDISKIIPSIGHKYIGFGLILLGLINILQKILYPLIDQYISWQIRNYIQTSIVSLVFIVIGIKILLNKKDEDIEGEEDYED